MKHEHEWTYNKMQGFFICECGEHIGHDDPAFPTMYYAYQEQLEKEQSDDPST